ncbi:MAG: 50S ribosomal protein L23 [Oligoflexales bacterium]|nr:50S ribosomal protein L23 [Oligoflexales bacterium]
MNVYDVLIKPLLSEKSVSVREQLGRYVFLVRQDANKEDVRSAVEQLFDVKVLKVNTALIRGKIKRRGMHLSKRSNSKKAYITLREGQKIKIFDDQ